MASTHTNLLFHIVFSTKYRQYLIKGEQQRTYEYIGGLIRKRKGIAMQIGGMQDHVHILAKLSPTVAISDMLGQVKANSSKWFNENFQPASEFAWQRGYGAFSVSASNVERVRAYIKEQEKHHRGVSFENEYQALLRRHGIEYDEQYLFEQKIVV